MQDGSAGRRGIDSLGQNGDRTENQRAMSELRIMTPCRLFRVALALAPLFAQCTRLRAKVPKVMNAGRHQALLNTEFSLENAPEFPSSPERRAAIDRMIVR